MKMYENNSEASHTLACGGKALWGDVLVSVHLKTLSKKSVPGMAIRLWQGDNPV